MQLIGIAALGAALVLLAAISILAIVRRQRTPSELRGDWWPRFEREFRAYDARASKTPIDRKRPARRRQAPPRS